MNLCHAWKQRLDFPLWFAQCCWSTLLSDFNFTLVPSQCYSPGTSGSGWGKCVCVCVWGCIVPEMLMWLWFMSESCQVCPSGWTFSEQPHSVCVCDSVAKAIAQIWSGRKVDVVYLAQVKSLAWVKWFVPSLLALWRHTLDRCCPLQSPAVPCACCPVQIRFFWHDSCWASS